MGLDTVQVHYEIDSPSVLSHHKVRVFNTPEATPVSGFVEEVRTPDTSDISSFGAVNYLSRGRSDDWKETGLRNFASLVSNRFRYLEGLQNLESDWVSGGAVKPSSSAIFLSQALLVSISKWVISEEVSVIPRIVMGPIPSGGIIVELHADDDNAINVTITNNGRVDLEVLYGGSYFEVNLSRNELIGMVPSQYASISR
jgi:hypothetical protein